ncbi:MAG: HU family DNA-binding protein [Puniceicoccales bacterium]|jgi:DNA-binding protein HU-beta|nr:HU family DNA-binding protein [Puniceicoccales bacterium]
MNKSELINEIYGLLNSYQENNPSDHKFTKVFAEKTLDIVLDAITRGVKRDEIVQVVGFGTFSVAKRGARTGVNPRTGDKIEIGASKAVKFKAGAKLKEIL